MNTALKTGEHATTRVYTCMELGVCQPRTPGMADHAPRRERSGVHQGRVACGRNADCFGLGAGPDDGPGAAGLGLPPGRVMKHKPHSLFLRKPSGNTRLGMMLGLLEKGKATADQLFPDRNGMGRAFVTRISELRAAGLLKSCGTDKDGSSTSQGGRPAAIYTLTERGALFARYLQEREELVSRYPDLF